jgi:hypothetical protein
MVYGTYPIIFFTSMIFLMNFKATLVGFYKRGEHLTILISKFYYLPELQNQGSF